MPIYKGSEKIKDIAFTGQNTNCLTHIPQDVKIELDPLNATIAGSLTIANGVVSGFSADNYLKVPKSFTPSNKTWEIGFKIKTGSSYTVFNDICGWYGGNYSAVAIGISNSTKKLHVSIGDGSNTSAWTHSVKTSFALADNTTYWFKVKYTGSQCIIEYSTNGKDYIVDGTTNVSLTFPSGNFLWGKYKDNSSNFFSGSIDFSQAYIKLNGSLWWQGGTGNVILKAGSKVYDGNGLFNTLTSDSVSNMSFAAHTNLYFYEKTRNTILSFPISMTSSGATLPSDGTNYRIFYNTSDKKLYRWLNNAWVNTAGYSFPICYGVSNGTGTITINQIFNGFGYIGSTVFALPGVKGLIPNGRNADGSLRNIEFTVESVLIQTRNFTAAYTNKPLVLKGDSFSYYITANYDEAQNLNFSGDGTDIGRAVVGTWSCDSNGKITSFVPKAVESSLKPQYIDKVYKGSTLVYQGAYTTNQVVFEKSTAGTYSVNFEKAGLYEITVVGGGGAAAMRGVYDDKGYGWTGGSGGAFVGTFVLERGTRKVIVAKANNNTTAQSGNTQTLNPTDTGTYASIVEGVVAVGGGGSGHYNSSYVGGAGAAANLTMTPTSTTLNTAGNAGNYGSGGSGGGTGTTINGGASVYNGYGKGQGCVVSEYATKRSWINGTAGYVKIVYKGSRN